MPWKQLDSTHLNRVRYFRGIQMLVVEFKDKVSGKGDRIWLYAKVPWKLYMGLVRAEDHGVYFARHIRLNDSFTRQEITREDAIKAGLLSAKKGVHS